MLSMKVVVAKPARASGAEFPHATPVAKAAGLATGGALAVVGGMVLSVEVMTCSLT